MWKTADQCSHGPILITTVVELLSLSNIKQPLLSFVTFLNVTTKSLHLTYIKCLIFFSVLNSVIRYMLFSLMNGEKNYETNYNVPKIQLSTSKNPKQWPDIMKLFSFKLLLNYYLY